MGKYAFFLTRVRYTTPGGDVKTYWPMDVIEIGENDSPPEGDEIYTKYCVCGFNEEEVKKVGTRILFKKGREA